MPVARKKKSLMKIGELCRITGVARDAIHFYIREGLLPGPIKTKKNMAYYDASYIERIKLIKELQSKRFLPLSVIKQILTESEGAIGIDEIKTIIELDGKLFRNMDVVPEFKPLSLSEAADRFGIDAADIEMFREIGVIEYEEMDGKKVFREDNVRLIELLAMVRKSGFTEELGFSTEVFSVYRDLIEVLARKEVEIFTTRLTGKVSYEESIRMAEAAIHLMNSCICLMRKRTILKIIKEYGMQARGRETP